MTDLQLKDFTIKIDALQPPLKGDIVLNSFITVTEMIGQYLVIKFITNIATIIKEKDWTNSESAEGVTEDFVEDLAEESLDSGFVDASNAASVASLEDTGESLKLWKTRHLQPSRLLALESSLPSASMPSLARRRKGG